jgi:hypothetical protein
VLRKYLARRIQQTHAGLLTGGFDFHFGHHLLAVPCVVLSAESLLSSANAPSAFDEGDIRDVIYRNANIPAG